MVKNSMRLARTRVAAQEIDVGRFLQLAGDSIRHLLLHLPRRSARPDGANHHHLEGEGRVFRLREFAVRSTPKIVNSARMKMTSAWCSRAQLDRLNRWISEDANALSEKDCCEVLRSRRRTRGAPRALSRHRRTGAVTALTCSPAYTVCTPAATMFSPSRKPSLDIDGSLAVTAHAHGPQLQAPSRCRGSPTPPGFLP